MSEVLTLLGAPVRGAVAEVLALSGGPVRGIVASPAFSFWAGYALILVLPGPNMLSVAAIAAAKGVRGALPLSLGLALGVAALATLVLLTASTVASEPALVWAGRCAGAMLLGAIAWRIAWPVERPVRPAQRQRFAVAEFGAGLCTAFGNPISAGFFLSAGLAGTGASSTMELGTIALGVGGASLARSVAVASLSAAAANRASFRMSSPVRLAVAAGLVALAATMLLPP